MRDVRRIRNQLAVDCVSEAEPQQTVAKEYDICQNIECHEGRLECVSDEDDLVGEGEGVVIQRKEKRARPDGSKARVREDGQPPKKTVRCEVCFQRLCVAWRVSRVNDV